MPFPRPTDGYEDPNLSDTLNNYLVPKPSSTLLYPVQPEYPALNLSAGDLLIIEKGRNPHNACHALVNFQGDNHLVQLFWHKQCWWANNHERSGRVTDEFTLIGVVTKSICNQIKD